MTFQHKANLNLKPNPYSLSTTRQKQIITTKYGDVFDGGLKLRGSSHITDPWYGVKKNNLWTWDQKQLEIMLTGRAPWGKDGKKVELHHRAQQPNGPLDEMSNSEHKKMSKVFARFYKISQRRHQP